MKERPDLRLNRQIAVRRAGRALLHNLTNYAGSVAIGTERMRLTRRGGDRCAGADGEKRSIVVVLFGYPDELELREEQHANCRSTRPPRHGA